MEIGKWHAIVAKKRRESVELIVDGKLVSREPFRDSGGFLLEAPILIGAATEREDIAALTRVQSGFRGCLKEVSPSFALWLLSIVAVETNISRPSQRRIFMILSLFFS